MSLLPYTFPIILCLTHTKNVNIYFSNIIYMFMLC